MKLCLSSTLVRVSPLIFIGILLSEAKPASSQITPDNTLGDESSVVNPRNETSDRIDGGELRGQNLFLSFEEFNVGEGRGAYFANPDAVSNIFSRVTGNNVSNILGTLGVDGAANLYLVNPNGIVFGENSSLDVRGSFTATTADAIEFGEGGLFSAIAPGESLLNISVPLGLQFGSSPGSIINQSFTEDETGEFVGLQVPTGKNLTLVGGEVRFEAGEATAKGGNINIGGLGAAGTVGVNNDGSLIFPEDIERADLLFENAADIDVRGIGGGNIVINARNFELADGEFGNSTIRAGIVSDSTNFDAEAGDIVINTSENITLNNIRILNIVESGAEGNAGDIKIDTNSLTSTNGGYISTSTFGKGNSGDIEIVANETIDLDGESTDGFSTGIGSFVNPEAEGNAGDIIVSTNNLNLTNGSRVDASIFGNGNAGAINLAATGAIIADGESSKGLASGIASSVASDALGDAGIIAIISNFLNLTNNGAINISTLGLGNPGTLNINANFLSLNNGVISSNSESAFDAGDITLNVANLLEANDSDISAISTQSGGGEIEITAKNILLRGDSDIRTNISSGAGSGANINIRADLFIAFDDSDIFTFAPDGQGGNIILATPAFFAESFTLNSLTETNQNVLENNNRADVNAGGAISSNSVVNLVPDSLTELSNNFLNTDELVANSCVVPTGDRSQGKFIITGGESLPVRPGGNLPSKYPTGEVRGASEDKTSDWQPGDPIVEAQDAYRLANGEWVLSRECPD